jgi:hypothetical protein
MSNATITGELASPREIAEVIRQELAGHNLRVVLLALLAAAAAAILWVALYAIAYWLTLLFLTAAKGIDTSVPAEFRPAFLYAAAFLLVFAWIDRRLHPDDRPRDKRATGEIVLDFVLMIPRVTLAVGSTLTAWQPLSARELARAASFIQQLDDERRIRLQTMPLEIPSERARARILFALQLTQFIEIRREDHDLWVKLNPLRPRLRAPRRG